MICRSVDTLSQLRVLYSRERDIKTKSLEQLDNTIDLLEGWYLATFQLPFTLPAMSETVVADFLFFCRDVRGNEPVTLNGKRRQLITLWRFAKSRGLLPAPEVSRIIRFKEPKRIPRAWTQEQLAQIHAAIDSYRQRKRKPPGWDARHDHAVAMVIYDTAFRFTACLELELADLRDDGAIIANAETQKTFTDENKWLAPDTMRAIRAMPRPANSTKVFPWPYTLKNYGKRWKRILKAAGLPATRREGLQKMRRTSSTWMEALRPGSSKEHVGHRTSGLTDKHYNDPTIIQSVREKPCDVLPRPFKPQLELFER